MPVHGAPTSNAIFGLDDAQLSDWVERLGWPRFHGRQIYRWIYARRALDPACWTDLPRALRERLGRESRAGIGAVAGRARADDGTVKYRIALESGGSVEAVSMVQRDRRTLCLSSQVGCALACEFCLTGRMGLKRQMSTGEILGQVVHILAEQPTEDGSPFNLVFMGMGEPFHNYDNVLRAVRILTDENGFGLSRRRITVSTVGLAPAIERLAEEPTRPRLAVSLNATTDALRDRLMPINRRFPLARLLDACRTFGRTTGDPFTFEYVLLGGVNDSDADVDRLHRLTHDLPAKLNLIPFNAVPGELPFAPPSRSRVLAIRDALLARGRKASVRWSRGAEARAACGQLALLDPDESGGPS